MTRAQINHTQTLMVNNKPVTVHSVDNDVNGNPRYVVSWLHFGQTYDKALKNARKIGGRVYRAKCYGGGIVFSSYNLERTLSQVI